MDASFSFNSRIDTPTNPVINKIQNNIPKMYENSVASSSTTLNQGLYIIFQMDWKRYTIMVEKYSTIIVMVGSVPGNVWQYCYYTGLGYQDSQYGRLVLLWIKACRKLLDNV